MGDGMQDVDPKTVRVSSKPYTKKLDKLPGMEIYRCPDCNRVLFVGKLLPGCRVERVCKSDECRKKEYGNLRVFEKIA